MKNRIVLIIIIILIIMLGVGFFLLKNRNIRVVDNINSYFEDEYMWIDKKQNESLTIENITFSIEKMSLEKEKQYLELKITNNNDLFVHEISFNYFVYDGNNNIIFNNYTIPNNLQKSFEKRVNAVNTELFINDEMEYKEIDGEQVQIALLNEEKVTDVSNGKIYEYSKIIDKDYSINVSDVHLVLFNFKCRTQMDENEYKNIDTKNLVYDFKIN